MSKQDVLKKQPLLEMVTFISKPTLPWMYISSDYSITYWWFLLSWPGSKGTSVPCSSEPEIVKKSSGYQDAKQILKNSQEPWTLGKKAVYSWKKPLFPNLDSWVLFLLLNLLHSPECGQAWHGDPPAIKAGTPFTEPEEPVLSLFSGRWLCQAVTQQVSAVMHKSRQVCLSIPCLPAPLFLCHLHDVQIIRVFCCFQQDFENRSSKIKVTFLPFWLALSCFHISGVWNKI